jgi:predicted nuclease of predicted toxin-antitoxin system
MRFVVDECTGPAVGRWLVSQGHDVLSIYDQARGISDDEVLERAHAEGRILITNDKDFGEKVYRERRPHRGVVLLRLADERTAKKIEVLARLLGEYGDRVEDQYVVVTETQVRFAHSAPS